MASHWLGTCQEIRGLFSSGSAIIRGGVNSPFLKWLYLIQVCIYYFFKIEIYNFVFNPFPGWYGVGYFHVETRITGAVEWLYISFGVYAHSFWRRGYLLRRWGAGLECSLMFGLINIIQRISRRAGSFTAPQKCMRIPFGPHSYHQHSVY